MECAPQLGGHKQVLPLDEAGVNGVLDTLSDLLFVLVAACAIDVTVTSLDSVENGSLDFTGGRLPSSCTELEGTKKKKKKVSIIAYPIPRRESQHQC